MTFCADGDGGGSWIGKVDGADLRVTPGTEDDHVLCLQLAIEQALSGKNIKRKKK